MDHSSHLTRFGLNQFRTGQREVIDAVMAGRDCLCIMPTGGGKSLCFQLPAVARPGLTLVISPLIALMKDQVDVLNKLQIPATFINSSLEPPQRAQRTEAMIRGEYALVYIAPERLRSTTFVEAIRQIRVSLLAIDEAHCISQWGHDFRPDYSRLGSFRRRIGSPQTIALTATATKTVRDDIAQVLGLVDPLTFVSGFARENLHFSIESPGANSDKDRRLVDFLNATPGSGIIYAATRKTCEHLVELLQAAHCRPAAFYHAGMEPEQRKRIQEAFMSDQLPLIVATNAFGMGIDKRSLRFVLHYNMPGSVEAYYQEAGRAGRDGAPAECLLLYSHQDRHLQEFFIENSYPTQQVVRDVFQFLKSCSDDPIELTLQQIKDELNAPIGTEGIRVCETLLEKAGAIERLETHENFASVRIDLPHSNWPELLPREARAKRAVLRGLETLVGDLRGERVYFSPGRLAESLNMKWESVSRTLRELVKLKGIDYVPPFRGRAIHVLRRDASFDQLQIDFEELERRKANEYEKLNQIVRFVQSRRCRQLEILEYFGDADRRTCRRCDNCEGKGRSPTGRPATLSDRAMQRVWIAIQVVLSGAARTHGRIGKQLLAQMLTGSTSKKLKPLRLDRLPTFGRLSQLRQDTVSDLIHQLLAGGWLEQTEPTRYRPVIQISDRGREIMNSKFCQDAVQFLSQELASMIAGSFTSADEFAEERPPVAHQTPTPKSDVASTFSTATPDKRELPTMETDRPSSYWTWKLFEQGFGAREVCQIRRIDDRQMMKDLIEAAAQGLTTKRVWILNDDQITALNERTSIASPTDDSMSCDDLPHCVNSQEYAYYLQSVG